MAKKALAFAACLSVLVATGCEHRAHYVSGKLGGGMDSIQNPCGKFTVEYSTMEDIAFVGLAFSEPDSVTIRFNKLELQSDGVGVPHYYATRNEVLQETPAIALAKNDAFWININNLESGGCLHGDSVFWDGHDKYCNLEPLCLKDWK